MIQYILARAIEEMHPLVVIYQKKDEMIQRKVQPIAIYGDHVKVWDYDKKGPRTYILDRILAAQFYKKSNTFSMRQKRIVS